MGGRAFSSVYTGTVWSILAAAVPGTGSCQGQIQECEARAAANNVLRIDETAKRIFVRATEADLVDGPRRERLVRELDLLVRLCQPGWASEWSASFFSDAASAGYKDDEALAERVESGEWSRAYVGELQRLDSSLIIFPAMPERRRSLPVPSEF